MKGDVDAVAVVLRFPSGTVCGINNHRRATYGYDQRLEIHTSEVGRPSIPPSHIQGEISVSNLNLTGVGFTGSEGLTLPPTMGGMERYAEAYES